MGRVKLPHRALFVGPEMRESAAGGMFTFILGALGKKGSLSLMLARLEIRNLITAIVIDLGEIRDINCDNLCILTQSGSKREGNAGRGKNRRSRRWSAFRESLVAECDANGSSAKTRAANHWRRRER